MYTKVVRYKKYANHASILIREPVRAFLTLLISCVPPLLFVPPEKTSLSLANKVKTYK